MANPAELLYQQLTEWIDPESRDTSQARHLPHPEAWAAHRRAVNLLDQIEEALDFARDQAGQPMTMARHHLPDWTAMVFSWPEGWNTPADSLDPAVMEPLFTTAEMLQTVVPEFAPGGADALAVFLQVVDAKLSDADPFLQKHARRVIRHIAGLLDDWEILGEFRITTALRDLELILEELAKQQPKDPFLRKAGRFLWGVFLPGVASSMLADVAGDQLPAPADFIALTERAAAQLTAGGTWGAAGED